MDINKIIDIVRTAGEILKTAHLEKEQIFDKEGDANFVTAFDMKIQKYLIEKILEIVPDASFYGEEESTENKKEISDTGYTFIIDPIDGTTNFMFDYKTSCISVGIAYKGELYAGIVYNPYVDNMYTAVKGKGSYVNNKKLFIEDKGLEEGISAFGCARYNEDSTGLLFATISKLFYKTLAIRSCGSAAIDLSRIATGSNVVYFEMLLQPYDYAAAAVLIEEAGGVITQLDGSNITIDHGCSILAGTKKATAQLRELMDNCKADN